MHIGSQINKICGFSSPFNIEITDNGRVFVTEYRTKYVHILNLVSNRIKNFSIPKGNPTGLFVKGSIETILTKCTSTHLMASFLV